MPEKLFSPLVYTKLRIPVSHPQIVSRPRLLDRFTLEPGPVLFLACAPAGYGKTTLLVEWAQSLVSQNATAVWLSLDPADDDALHFAAYLNASLVEALGPTETFNHIQQVLRSAPEPDVHRIMQLLINAIARSERLCVLFLDDYHVISDPAVHDSIAYLLDHMPQNLRLVIGSRVDPPLPLGRLRARGRLVEIRTPDLRFIGKESEAYLNDRMRLALSPELVRDLEARTEGWAAGLQLASLSLSGRPNKESLIASFSGSHRNLVDYLLEEVLIQQSGEIRNFLLTTSILTRFSASLCDALSGDAFPSETILTKLEKADLFLIPLEDSGRWYRYHHLFQDFLRERLRRDLPEREAALHQKACVWYAENHMLREAAFHAFESGDWEYAAAFVEQSNFTLITLGEISLLADWCSQFPEEVMDKHPLLCILQCWAWVLTFSRRYHLRVHARLQQAEQAVIHISDSRAAAELREHAAVVRSFIAMAPDLDLDPYPYLEFSDLMLKRYPGGDPGQYSALLWKGYVYLALQETKDAIDTLQKALESALRGHLYFGVIEASFHLARLACAQGDLEKAEIICLQGREAVTAAITGGEGEMPAAGSLDIALGCILLEQNKLEQAEQNMLKGLELVGGNINPFHLATAYITLARLYHIQGRIAEAEDYLSRLEDTWPDTAFLSSGLKIAFQLSAAAENQSVLQEAAGWCRKFEKDFNGGIPEPGMGPLGAADIYYEAFLVWVRLCTALRIPDKAFQYLERQLETARKQDLKLRLIQLSLLEAQLANAMKQEDRSRKALEKALAAAEGEDFIQQFNIGSGLTDMLKHTGSDHPHRALVNRILSATGGVSGREMEAPVPPVSLPGGEYLTERELEVLVLISRGASNRDIGRDLFISVGTVKSHVNRILGKLDAKNRTEAAARARELGLIDP
ncbi:MAG: hypothetical protein JXA25_05370 [Anaerolineales bacterium]|nr:hypothetical protein [Anaerolineales bacterium]